MKNPTAGQDKMHHQGPIQGPGMGEDRSAPTPPASSRHDIMRAGGSDPHRPMAANVIERKVMDHDQSGYNHAYTPDSDTYARSAERKAMGMGTPHPDGTYSR